MAIDLVVPEDVELSTLLDGLRKLSWEAADVLMAYARGLKPPYGFPEYLNIHEDDSGPVSAADLAVNKLLLNGLKNEFSFSDWDILSEETSKEKDFNYIQLKNDWCWIIDPLDGTKDFLQGSENYAVHIALAYKKIPKIGIVLIPERNELWFGIIGIDTWCENRDGDKWPYYFSKRSDISELVLVSSKNHQEKRLVHLLEKMNFAQINKIGSVGCKVASILRGESDVYISLSGKTSPKDWDMAAPDAIIQAAGGSFTHENGQPLIYQSHDYSQAGCLIASHGKSHKLICTKVVDYLSI